IAHRGASYDAPENTIAAFALAMQRGADGFECDVWATGDGQILCLHDADTGRVGDGGGKKGSGLPVRTSTLEALQAIDVGRWKDASFAGQVPPTLAEALAWVEPGKRVFVEIKSQGGSGVAAVPEVLKVIDASGLDASQITVISFDADVVKRVKHQRPDFTVNWLTSFKRTANAGPWQPNIDEVLNTLNAIGADGLGCKAVMQHVDHTFVAALRERGYGFHLWTVNDPDIARRAIELGVDSLTTDRPGYLREQLLFGSTSQPGESPATVPPS
ncbi:MAG: glycerophosphodiester phosphodiesterase family protein, partial [Planctomycetota bacterium]